MLVVALLALFTERWFAFGHARMCFEHDGFPAPGGFCDVPSQQIEIKVTPPNPAGPVL